MATEFISSLDGTEYTSAATWETHTSVDLTAATTKVFSHSGITGTVGVGSTVTGSVTSTTGTVAAVVTSTQILLTGISGAGFNGSENMEVDGSNYVTSTNTGDSAICVLECYTSQSPLVEQVIFSGAVTNSTGYRSVRAAAGNGHGGDINGGFIFTNVAGQTGFTGTFDVLEDYNVFKDLVIRNTRQVDNCYAMRLQGSGSMFLLCDSIIVTANNVSAGATGFRGSVNDPGEFRNCLAYGCGGSGFFFDNFDFPTVNNCTAIGNNTSLDANQGGFRRNGNNGTAATFTNCVAYNNGNADFSIQNAARATGSYNASGDATEVGTNSVSSTISSSDFVDHSNKNWHIPTTSQLYASGTSLSGTFTNDWDGDIRANWSVGVDDGPILTNYVRMLI